MAQLLATLAIQEFDAAGVLLATQSVPIGTPVLPDIGKTYLDPSGVRLPIGSGFQSGPVPGYAQGLSAPFHPNTATLVLRPSSGGIAIIAFGTSPIPQRYGIVVLGFMSMAPQGARLAVL